jgi:hypothetical protein
MRQLVSEPTPILSSTQQPTAPHVASTMDEHDSYLDSLAGGRPLPLSGNPLLIYKHLALDSFLEPLTWLYLVQVDVTEFVVCFVFSSPSV